MNIDRERERLAKTIRAQIRLKHSLAADDEIASVLPAKMAEFEERLLTGPGVKILDFDIENRPLAYLAEDFTTGEVTVIAACFMDEPDSMRTWALGYHKPAQIVEGFRKMYNKADIVTGHYIRSHDLPYINGACMELKLPVLGPKLTVDTKTDLPKSKGISKSLENLTAMFGLSHKKVHLSNHQWRQANRLTKEGVQDARGRAEGDVREHMELYAKLLELEYICAPKIWRPR